MEKFGKIGGIFPTFQYYCIFIEILVLQIDITFLLFSTLNIRTIYPYIGIIRKIFLNIVRGQMNNKIIKIGALITALGAPIATVISCGDVEESQIKVKIHEVDIDQMQTWIDNGHWTLNKTGDFAAGTGSLGIEPKPGETQYIQFEPENNGHLSYDRPIKINLVTPKDANFLNANRFVFSHGLDYFFVTIAAPSTVPPVTPPANNSNPFTSFKDIEKLKAAKITHFENILGLNTTSLYYKTLLNGIIHLEHTKDDVLKGKYAMDVDQLIAEINKSNAKVKELDDVVGKTNSITSFNSIPWLKDFVPKSTDRVGVIREIEKLLDNGFNIDLTRFYVDVQNGSDASSIKIIISAIVGSTTAIEKTLEESFKFTSSTVVDDSNRIQAVKDQINTLENQLLSNLHFPNFDSSPTADPRIQIPAFDEAAKRAEFDKLKQESLALNDLTQIRHNYALLSNIIMEINQHYLDLRIAYDAWTELVSLTTFTKIFDLETAYLPFKVDSATINKAALQTLINNLNGVHLGTLVYTFSMTDNPTSGVDLKVKYESLGIIGEKTLTITNLTS